MSEIQQYNLHISLYTFERLRVHECQPIGDNPYKSFKDERPKRDKDKKSVYTKTADKHPYKGNLLDTFI